ncbi:polyadenylate-binding protein-interacting protein 2-like [Bolinopsis microptera]|uniref:polyadenylate-binding protein-interacting protein 2-like n=1 Tax=Bolinopsis microptera TaxID=2820187 RepID=UPI003078D381
MVVRPESPINNCDDDWFKDYEWMNEQENFEEEFLDSLHLEELNKVAQAIEEELVDTEVTDNMNNVRLSSSESEHNANNQSNDNEPVHQNGDILNSSNLNPNAAEFVPSFVRSR